MGEGFGVSDAGLVGVGAAEVGDGAAAADVGRDGPGCATVQADTSSTTDTDVATAARDRTMAGVCVRAGGRAIGDGAPTGGASGHAGTLVATPTCCQASATMPAPSAPYSPWALVTVSWAKSAKLLLLGRVGSISAWYQTGPALAHA